MTFKCFPPTELWRLIIDGYQHHLGPYAFDKPRNQPGNIDYHAGEAGYLKAMLEGLNYIIKHWKEPASVQLITALHKIATMDVENGEMTRNDSDLKEEDRKLIKSSDRGKMGRNATFSSTLSQHQPEQPGANNVSQQGFFELVTWLKENPRYQYYFQIVSENEILDLTSNNLFEFYQKNNIAWRCIKIPEKIVSEIIEDILKIFNEKIQTSSESEKLRLIVKLIHELEIIHPFQDGNCRTFVLLLNQLLIKNNLLPSLLINPNRFDGFSIDELVNEVKNGQMEYEKYLSRKCINLIQTIDPYKFNKESFQKALWELIGKEPYICAAQLNFIYQLINDRKISIPEKDFNLVLQIFSIPNKNALKKEVLITIKNLFNEINLDEISSEAIKKHIKGYDIYRDMHSPIPEEDITIQSNTSSARFSLH